MDTTNNSSRKDLMRQFYDSFNSGNFNEFDKFMTSDIIEHNPDPFIKSDKKGAEYVKEVTQTYKQAFPDLKMEPDYIVEEGDKLIAHLKITGTHTGNLGDIPPTNKKINVEAFDMVCFKDDKASEHWQVFDTFGLMNQLGLAGNNQPGQPDANPSRGNV